MTPRADLLSAAVWGAFGTLVVVASWRLPQLEQMGINPWSVPGLTPGLIGLAIVLAAAALALRAWRAQRIPRELRSAPPLDAAAAGDAPEPPASLRRSLLALLLCLAFAGVSLGHGLPFALEAAAFVFVFICVFSWRAWRAEQRVLRGAAVALLIAGVSATLIAWLFSAVFLVRLP
jgi:hypothetical protein